MNRRPTGYRREVIFENAKRIPSLWRAPGRGLWLGLLSLTLAAFAQWTIHDRGSPAISGATYWYVAALLTMLVAWHGTDKNRSCLGQFDTSSDCSDNLQPSAPATGDRGRAQAPNDGSVVEAPRAPGAPWSLSIAAMLILAGGLYFWGTLALRSADYDSPIGGLAWLGGLVVMLATSLRMDARRRPTAHRFRDAAGSALVFLREHKLEIVVFCLILAMALALRIFRLGDWTTGMHGDEGEVGMAAIRILEGGQAPPFRTGWFEQPNFYYWAVAISMKLFGTGLFGLRIFATLVGTAMLIPFYLLVRQLFGTRMAIISSIFLAMSDVAIHFSRLQFSNITTPFFLVLSFFFLARGLQSRRITPFVLSGFALMANLHFYLGGRIAPVIAGAFLGYLFVVRPLAGVAETRRELASRQSERAKPGLAGTLALLLEPVWVYRIHLASFLLACGFFAAPWTAYYLDHQKVINARIEQKLIFNNLPWIVARYDLQHEPLHLGLRGPVGEDGLQFPAAFENTPVSVRLAQDGLWVRALWRQLTATLSVLTLRPDASSVYTFTGEPVAKWPEAALIVLGIAWSLWRWRDSRMALLSIWFWSTVLLGGVLTTNAPYMARLIPILPLMAIFAALPLEKLASEAERFSRSSRSTTAKNLAKWGTALGIVGLLGFLLWQNTTDYYGRYLGRRPFRETTGLACFVRDTRARLILQGRPEPRFVHLGVHQIYRTHGVNRFLNRGAIGFDGVNVSELLPILEDTDREVVFIIWQNNRHYLPMIRLMYPNGIEEPFLYGPPEEKRPLFTSFRVSMEEIKNKRTLNASYVPSSGPATSRKEATLGSHGSAPTNLTYPVEASWSGFFYTPNFGKYRLRLRSAAGGELFLDGRSVMKNEEETSESDVVSMLSKGLHRVELTGRLLRPDSELTLLLASESEAVSVIPTRFLWTGPGPTLLGEIRRWTADRPPSLDSKDEFETLELLQRRRDVFLGFRNSQAALSSNTALVARWTGAITIEQAGTYGFSLSSNGDSILLVDEMLVVDNRHGANDLRQENAQWDLAPGVHEIEVRYSWLRNFGALEAFWTPPDGTQELLSAISLD